MFLSSCGKIYVYSSSAFHVSGLVTC